MISLISLISLFSLFSLIDNAPRVLPTGSYLGVYEVISAIGAGGMGEVYRARDTRLNRHVAIKILPAAFASDPERIARFTREAQTLAALNHPHIAQLYGIEESREAAGPAPKPHTTPASSTAI